MSDSERSIDRRTVLKGVGGAAILGTVGTAAFAGSGAAQASMDVDVSGTEYSGDQGQVNWFGVNVGKKLTWDGFDVPVRYLGIKHEVTIENDTTDTDTPWHTLYDKRTDRLTEWSSKGSGSDGWGGPGEFIASHGGDKADYLRGDARMDAKWAIISDGSHPSDYDSVQTPVDWTDALSVEADGATKKRVLRWKTTITFYTEGTEGNPVEISDDDGVAQIQGTDRIGITVTNEGGTTGGSSTGSSTIN